MGYQARKVSVVPEPDRKPAFAEAPGVRQPTSAPSAWLNKVAPVIVACLFLILTTQMIFAIRWQSQTFDEANHILAGYRYWRCGDFGTNAEHPPLVKMLATVPLLFDHIQMPVAACGSSLPSSARDFVDGRNFLYANDANRILFETRLAAGTITLILALLVFAAAKEMFGLGAAIVALALTVFEPNLLAHGTLVHTDLGVTLGLFAAVYFFYRYVKAPNIWRLVAVGSAVGLALVTKLSGILIIPFFGCLLLGELWLRHNRRLQTMGGVQDLKADLQEAMRLTSALAVAGAIALVVLWGAYGFRFSARPSGEPIVMTRSTTGTGLLAAIPRWHLLPEAYYYGFSYQLMMAHSGRLSFLLGKLYPHGRWFYFPLVFLIKSTLGFLLLSLVALAARPLWRSEKLREILFVSIPPLLLLGFSVASANNLGIRYILPVYPFLIVLVAAGASLLAAQHRVWAYVVVVLLAFHALSTLRSLPNYLAYSNEAWGGTAHTYRLLTDSNVDWGQSLKDTAAYLNHAGIRDCWFADSSTADPHYYGIPCKLLDAWPAPESVPTKIQGTVLVSTSEISGLFSGPAELNPYAQFASLHPKDNIDGTVLVFEGNFDVTLASSMSHMRRAEQLADANRLDEALAEAQTAVALAPSNPAIRLSQGELLSRAQRHEEARSVFETTLALARTIHPEFQQILIRSLQHSIDPKP